MIGKLIQVWELTKPTTLPPVVSITAEEGIIIYTVIVTDMLLEVVFSFETIFASVANNKSV
jgi:hypothetical protein